jgi:hypothetical protein
MKLYLYFICNFSLSEENLLLDEEYIESFNNEYIESFNREIEKNIENIWMRNYEKLFSEENILNNYKVSTLEKEKNIIKNKKEFSGISFIKIYNNLKETFMDLKNLTNMDINIIKKCIFTIWGKFSIVTFLKNFLYFLVWLLVFAGILIGVILYSLEKVFYSKNILTSKVWLNTVGNSFYKGFLLKNKNLKNEDIKNKDIKTHMIEMDEDFLEKNHLAKKETIIKLEEKVNNLINAIKLNQKYINDENLKIIIDGASKSYFHFKKIHENFKTIEFTQDKELQKKITIEVLQSIYYVLDIFIEILKNKDLNNKKNNINIKELLEKVIEVVSFLLPTEDVLLKLLLNSNILESIQKSLKNLINRKEQETTITFYKIEEVKKDLFYELVESNKYIDELSIFDEEFYEDILITSIENINAIFPLPIDVFDLISNQIKNYLLVPEIIGSIKNIIYINMNAFSQTRVLHKKEKNNADEKNVKIDELKINQDEKIINQEKNNKIKNFLIKEFIFYKPKKLIKKPNIATYEINKFDYEKNEDYSKYKNFLKSDEEMDFPEYIKFFFDSIDNIPSKYEDILFLIYYFILNKSNGYKELIYLLKKRFNVNDILNIKNFIFEIDLKEIILFIEEHSPKLIKISNFFNFELTNDLNKFFTTMNNENYCKLIFNYINQENKEDFTEYLKYFNSLLGDEKIEKIYNTFITKIKNGDSLKNIINDSNSENLLKIILFFKYSLSIEDSKIEFSTMFKNINNNYYHHQIEKNFLDIESDSQLIIKILRKINIDNKTDEYIEDIIYNTYKVIDKQTFIEDEINELIKSIHNILTIINKNNLKRSIDASEEDNQEILLHIILLLLEDLTTDEKTNSYSANEIIKNYLGKKNLSNNNIKGIIDILNKIKDKKTIGIFLKEMINVLLENTTTDHISVNVKKTIFSHIKNLLSEDFINMIADLINNFELENENTRILINELNVAEIFKIFVKFFLKEIEKINYKNSSKEIISLMVENFQDSSEFQAITKIISDYVNTKYKTPKDLLEIISKIPFLKDRKEIKQIKTFNENQKNIIDTMMKSFVPSILLVIRNYSLPNLFNPQVYKNLLGVSNDLSNMFNPEDEEGK